MKYCYIEIYLLIVVINANAEIQDQFGTKNIDCNHKGSTNCDIHTKKLKRIISHDHSNRRWTSDNLKLKKYDDYRNFRNENDSFLYDEKKLPIQDDVDAFENQIVTKLTTIESATRWYQENKASEERDQYRNTVDCPFSASIQRKGAHYTSGVLLDKSWIITSAGEFIHIRESLKLFRARLGSVDCKRGGVVIPIKKIHIHPYYLHGKPNFDVALLRLAYDVDFTDYIRPIAISDNNGKVISAKFMTTYWPRILLKGSALPVSARERTLNSSIRVSTQHFIPSQMCSRAVAIFNQTLNEASLCLKPVVSHHSVCMPDAGAPVIAEDVLWGIISGWTAPTCSEIAGPTIFTRLSSPSVRSWLDAELL